LPNNSFPEEGLVLFFLCVTDFPEEGLVYALLIFQKKGWFNY